MSSWKVRHAFGIAAVMVCPLSTMAAPQTDLSQKEPARLEVKPSPANVSASYVLGPGDELVIHALDTPEISEKTLRVDPDGDLRLAIIGRVHAAGMTIAALEEELKRRLAVFLKEPDVTVSVTSSRSQTISIMGAVMSPGLKPLTNGTSLLDVLSAGGGVSLDAGPSIRVVRRLDQGPIPLAAATSDASAGFSVAEFDLRALLDGRSPEKNIAMMPNDVVAIPRADVVYVIGEVGKPGALPLSASRSMTVMEAVSTSGGALRTAAPSRARILRRVAGQDERTEITVDLQRMMQGKAKDVSLMVGDILVIPDSSGKRFATRAVEAAIQTGMMIGTYGIVR